MQKDFEREEEGKWKLHEKANIWVEVDWQLPGFCLSDNQDKGNDLN